MLSITQLRDASFVRFVANAGAAALMAIVLLFAIRRMAGAFESPLPVMPLFATMFVFSVLLGVLRCAESRLVPHDSARWGWRLIAIGLAIFAFSWPMGRVWDWVIWAPLVAGEFFFLRQNGFARRASKLAKKKSADKYLEAENPCHAADETVLQQLSRVRDTKSGVEMVHGSLRAEFASDEQSAVIHVAFCPPFEAAPRVEAEHADGPNAMIRVTQVLPEGARIEVRLSTPPATPTYVLLDFAASVAPVAVVKC